MAQSSKWAPSISRSAPVPGAGFEIWPHPYQVDHVGWAYCVKRPLVWIAGPLRFSPDRRRSPLLVSATGVGRQ